MTPELTHLVAGPQKRFARGGIWVRSAKISGFRNSHLLRSSWSGVRALVTHNPIELSVADAQIRWKH